MRQYNLRLLHCVNLKKKKNVKRMENGKFVRRCEFGSLIERNGCRVGRFALITSLLFKNASICTWFRMLDFNSLANFALNAFFWLMIRKVSSWGAVRGWQTKTKRKSLGFYWQIDIFICECCLWCASTYLLHYHLISASPMLTKANGIYIYKLKQTIKLTSINNACKCQKLLRSAMPIWNAVECSKHTTGLSALSMHGCGRTG